MNVHSNTYKNEPLDNSVPILINIIGVSMVLFLLLDTANIVQFYFHWKVLPSLKLSADEDPNIKYFTAGEYSSPYDIKMPNYFIVFVEEKKMGRVQETYYSNVLSKDRVEFVNGEMYFWWNQNMLSEIFLFVGIFGLTLIFAAIFLQGLRINTFLTFELNRHPNTKLEKILLIYGTSIFLSNMITVIFYSQLRLL